MIIECCSQEKTFVRYYALLGSRFCMLRKEFQVRVRGCGGGGLLRLCGAPPESVSGATLRGLRQGSQYAV